MKLLKWVLALIAVTVVGAIFFGGYGGLSMLMGLVAKAPAQASAPKGTLLLSIGAVLSATGTSSVIVPATLPIANTRASYLAADQLKSGRAMTLQYSLSADSRYATFIGSPYVNGAKSGVSVSESMNVYRADLTGVHDGVSLLTALQAASIWSHPSNADYFRQFPAVASSGDVLYSSLSQKTFAKSGGSLATLPADSWNIIMSDVTGTTTAITQGLRPKWIDATHFAYLKNDGIYLYDLAAKTSQKVSSVASEVTIVQGFDVSDDGQYIAFSDPVTGAMTIIRALNWTGNIFSLIVAVPVAATNLAFSPDDNYLAAVVLRPSTDGSGHLVSDIEYYSLETQQFLSNAVTIDPSITSMYISDWR